MPSLAMQSSKMTLESAAIASNVHDSTDSNVQMKVCKDRPNHFEHVSRHDCYMSAKRDGAVPRVSIKAIDDSTLLEPHQKVPIDSLHFFGRYLRPMKSSLGTPDGLKTLAFLQST